MADVTYFVALPFVAADDGITVDCDFLMYRRMR